MQNNLSLTIGILWDKLCNKLNKIINKYFLLFKRHWQFTSLDESKEVIQRSTS